jgi:predicted cation transporter
MSNRSYKVVLAILGLICAVLTPLRVLEIVSQPYGTAAFVAVIGWVVYGATRASRQKQDSERR